MYRFSTALIFILSMIPFSAHADLVPARDISCYQDVSATTKTIAINMRLGEADLQKLASPDQTQQMIQLAGNIAAAFCAKAPDERFANGAPMPRNFSSVWVRVTPENTGVGNLFSAHYSVSTNSWKIDYNNIAAEAAGKQQALQRQQTEAAQKVRERESKAAIRKPFIEQNGVQSFTNVSQLSANPFPFKDKVVALRADFSQMVSANEARFGDLFVSNISPTQFTSAGRSSILALKVTGLKPVRTPVGGELNVPYGSFVGIYFCTKQDCSEFFD